MFMINAKSLCILINTCILIVIIISNITTVDDKDPSSLGTTTISIYHSTYRDQNAINFFWNTMEYWWHLCLFKITSKIVSNWCYPTLIKIAVINSEIALLYWHNRMMILRSKYFFLHIVLACLVFCVYQRIHNIS